MALDTLQEALSILGWPDASSLPEEDGSFGTEDAYIILGLPVLDMELLVNGDITLPMIEVDGQVINEVVSPSDIQGGIQIGIGVGITR